MTQDLEKLFPRRLQPVLTRERSQLNFSVALQSPRLGKRLRATLAKANVLLVPQKASPEVEVLAFPSGTEDLFLYLRDNAPRTIKVDIGARDEDYAEVAKHEALVIVATILTTSLIFPVVVNLVSDWLKRRLGRQHSKAEVKAEFIVTDEAGTSTALRYEGPAQAFNETMRTALRQPDEGKEPLDA